MTFAHEIGHYLDHDLFGRGTYFTSEDMVDGEANFLGAEDKLLAISPSAEEARAFQVWWDALTNSDAYQAMENFNPGIFHVGADGIFKPGPVGGLKNYFYTPGMLRSWKQPSEYFARSYSQYIATRSGDTWMDNELQSELDVTRRGGAPTHWEPDDFEPIAEAFDGLFDSLGLLR